MAREKLNQDAKRKTRFSVYVNEQEAELIKKYAKDAETNPTDYLRRAGLNQMKKVVPGVNREKWRELGNLVGLLNQIAKGVNIGQVQNIKISLLEEIKSEVQKLRINLISENYAEKTKIVLEQHQKKNDEKPFELVTYPSGLCEGVTIEDVEKNR